MLKNKELFCVGLQIGSPFQLNFSIDDFCSQTTTPELLNLTVHKKSFANGLFLILATEASYRLFFHHLLDLYLIFLPFVFTSLMLS
jgi:hypothetical protein